MQHPSHKRALEQGAGGVLIEHLWLGTKVPGNRNRLPKKSNVTTSVNRPIYGCGTRLMGQHRGGDVIRW